MNDPLTIIDEPAIEFPALWAAARQHPWKCQSSAYEDTVRAMETQWKHIADPIYREPFEIDKVASEVDRAAVQRVLDYEYSPRGLYICGGSGHGKSRAVYSLMRRMLEEGRTVDVLTGIPFAVGCTEALRNEDLTLSWRKRMLRPACLFLDDFGKRLTPATHEGFYDVLEHRSAHRRPTFITTQFTGDLIRERMAAHDAEAILRRLKEFCEVIVL